MSVDRHRLPLGSVAELLAEAREEEARALDGFLEAIAAGRPVPDADRVGFRLPLLPSKGTEADLELAHRTIADLVLRLRVANRRVARLRLVALAAKEGGERDVAAALAALEAEDLRP